jgi:magnesium-transporting ATPase (P-type)
MKDEGKIKALVINTGFNTLQGNLFQNILFPRPTNFKFYNDVKLFVYAMVIIWIILSIIKVVLFINKNNSQNSENGDDDHIQLFKRIIDDLTVVIPPILPICMTFTSFYFHINLMRKNIFSISDIRMNAAGRMNIIILDKTGTLTEEGLDLYGFQTTKINNSVVEITEIEHGAEIYNIIYKEFYKKLSLNPEDPKFENYQNNYKNNIIYFLECLATCHSIDKIKEDCLGNSIDKTIYDKIKWIQEKNENFWKDKVIQYKSAYLQYDST